MRLPKIDVPNRRQRREESFAVYMETLLRGLNRVLERVRRAVNVNDETSAQRMRTWMGL